MTAFRRTVQQQHFKLPVLKQRCLDPVLILTWSGSDCTRHLEVGPIGGTGTEQRHNDKGTSGVTLEAHNIIK